MELEVAHSVYFHVCLLERARRWGERGGERAVEDKGGVCMLDLNTFRNGGVCVKKFRHWHYQVLEDTRDCSV